MAVSSFIGASTSIDSTAQSAALSPNGKLKILRSFYNPILALQKAKLKQLAAHTGKLHILHQLSK